MAHVVVIGAGLGGLSAACHLVGAGHEVSVYERESLPGGRAGIWEEEGYRIDTGPVVLTMKGLISSTFEAAGASMDDFLDLHALDPLYRACYRDGSEILCRRGTDAMAEEIRNKCSDVDADGFMRMSRWLTSLYENEMPNFIARNFDSPLDMARSPGPLVELLKLKGLRKLSSTVNSYMRDERLQRLFTFQSLYAGLSPLQALGIFGVITYMDSIEGVYFPAGGMHKVATGLAQAAEKAGVSFHYSSEVETVVRAPITNRATGIKVDAKTITADAVVINADLPTAYHELLAGVEPSRILRHGTYSPSCALWLAGVRGEWPSGAAHHNIHFGSEWAPAFESLIDKGELMSDPSILVTSPTVTDSTLAPEGRHIIYALEPVPNLDGNVDWNRQSAKVRDRLVSQLGNLGYPVDVEVERFVDPPQWQRQGMAHGTPFSLSHRFFQSGPFRPNNIDSRVPGVYFTGSGTVPGVGIPMVLISGRLAAERVAKGIR